MLQTKVRAPIRNTSNENAIVASARPAIAVAWLFPHKGEIEQSMAE